MALRLIEIIGNKHGIKRDPLELVSDGLVLVEYNNYSQRGAVNLLHWRIGNWKKPPLDITLNSGTGELSSISYFFQDDDKYSKAQLHIEQNFNTGTPRFDTSIWKANDPYLDNHDEIIHSWIDDSDLLLIFANVAQPISKVLELDRSLSLLFNENNELSGLKMQEFTSDERLLLQSLSD